VTAYGPTDPIWALLATEAKVRPPHVYHLFHARREAGKRFNPDAYALYAQMERKHVDRIIIALDSRELKGVRKPVDKAERGSRLAPDFIMPAEWIGWAQTERGWTRDVAGTVADQFKDYWTAAVGAKAVKLDWQATWRNWVRGSKREDGDFRGKAVRTPEEEREFATRTIAFYRKIGRDSEAEEWERKLVK
jgi:hypothetical protein